jgi:hypothetical protein
MKEFWVTHFDPFPHINTINTCEQMVILVI